MQIDDLLRQRVCRALLLGDGSNEAQPATRVGLLVPRPDPGAHLPEDFLPREALLPSAAREVVCVRCVVRLKLLGDPRLRDGRSDRGQRGCPPTTRKNG